MRRTTVLAFALLLAAAALLVAGCGGGTDVGATPETVVGTLPADTTEETDTTEDTPAPTGDAAAGESIFASNGCGGCHTLAAAGTTGNVGPNLDDAKSSTELVVDRVTNGRGSMPAFGEQLDPQQIADVAAYVVESTGG